MGVCMLLAGCSLFGGGEEDKGMDTKNITTKDPKERFEQLSAANRNAFADMLLETMGNMAHYQKSKADFSVSGKVLLEMMNGNLNFSVKSSSKTDRSSENIQMDASLDASAKMESPIASGEGKVSLALLAKDGNYFASLKDFSLNAPEVPSDQVMASITPLIGTWYGGTAAEIDELLGGNTSIETLFRSAKSPGEIQQEVVEIIRNTPLFAFSEKSDSGKEGLESYKVTVDTNAFQEMVGKILEVAEFPEQNIEATKEDMRSNMAGVNISGIVGFSSSDPLALSFEGSITNTESPEKNGDISVFLSENEKSFRIKSMQGVIDFVAKKEGNTKTFALTEGEEGKKLLSGNMSEKTFEMSFYNTSDAEEKEVAHISLEKNEEKWSGTMTNNEQPDIVFLIHELSFDAKTLILHVELKKGEVSLADIEMSYLIEEIKNIDITPPQEFEPFSVLTQKVLPLLFGASPTPVLEEGVPSDSLPSNINDDLPEGMSEEELNAMIEQAMIEQANGGIPSEEDTSPDAPSTPTPEEGVSAGTPPTPQE